MCGVCVCISLCQQCTPRYCWFQQDIFFQQAALSLQPQRKTEMSEARLRLWWPQSTAQHILDKTMGNGFGNYPITHKWASAAYLIPQSQTKGSLKWPA